MSTTEPEVKVKITSGHIRAALRDRYRTSSHALMFEVGNGTGHNTNRHADAVVMGLWPSRGLEIEGIEIKVSRADWKKELADHEKADAIQRYCDRWWIAAPKGLIPPAELPASWGLLELDDKALRQKVAAPKLEAIPPNRTFIAAMLRRASDADHDELKTLVSKQLQVCMAEQERHAKKQIEHLTSEATKVLKMRDEIKESTGIDLRGWTPSSEISAAIKFALKSGILGGYGSLQTVASHAERLVKEIHEFTAYDKESQKDGS